MKNLLTTVRKHGSGKTEVALKSDSPSAHRRFIKPLKGSKRHPQFAEVTIWKRVRTFEFNPTRDAQPPALKPNIVQRAIEAVKPKRKTPVRKSAFAQRVAAANT